MSAASSGYDPVGVEALDPANLERDVQEALASVTAATDLAGLADARRRHLGDRSPLALANREIGALPPAARAEAGQRVGAARSRIRAVLESRGAQLEVEAAEHILVTEVVDVTLPWQRRRPGARHPLTTLAERIGDIFVAMGFEVADGPEVEAEWLNFDALNIGADHPARSMQDTFFIDPLESGLVLRTHTSPVQARTLLSRQPPVHVVVPGRVYRSDELDATHTPVFHQVEGLVVDQGITFGHLKGTLEMFAAEMFGTTLALRWRPSYFPFTEPSAEVDLECFACRGASVGDPDAGCRTCGSQGWIEWGGCGVVNPRVLVACGVDPDRYSGFAFGMGLERTLMFRHGITDMHDLVEGDVRFTRAFGMEI